MQAIDNSKVRILLVDDTPVNLEIAGKILEQEGYDLYIADSGDTALQLTSENAFDLILLDIMMPDMDGFETCYKIREGEKNKDVPVIFLTAKVDIDSIVNGFELGAVDYIRKPYNGMELKVRVKNHIELKKAREEMEEKNLRLQEAYDQLKVLATTDPLTKLLNRREMLNRIEYEKTSYGRKRQPFSLIICDIDFFKKVNDNYGHECGDLVLKHVAKLLGDNIRDQDSACRWGGEEFLLLLPDTFSSGSAVLAEKLREVIENTDFEYNGNHLKLTMTFGISNYRGTGSLDELISSADKAMYEGKKNGRNCIMKSD
ncbi:MAG: diguanylate cyclase [Pseudomonadota bacterium]